MADNSDLEQRVRDALHEQADRAPAPPLRAAPWEARTHMSFSADTTVPGSEQPLRQRSGTAWRVLGVAAAVAIVSVGTTLTIQAVQDGDDPAQPSAQPGANVEIDDPVPVGLASVVVDVPRSWARGTQQCAAVSAPTVLFETDGRRSCGTSEPTADTVSIRRDGHSTDDDTTPGNTDIQVTKPRQDGAGFTVVSVEDAAQGVTFEIRTRDTALAAAIADSARALDSDQTTMPDVTFGFTGGVAGSTAPPDVNEVTRRLEASGLTAEIHFADGATAKRWGSVTPSIPTGTVVPTGTTIVVTYGPTAREPNT
ncbi:hypothetical protein GCM10009795_005040 [Nocardioides hankookensis]|uniref:PASTA domain-containing protein n=1 Tax=Nocardioides hankookensis TaxID=443157 RepID=A0ABW1LLP4_9ACTN